MPGTACQLEHVLGYLRDELLVRLYNGAKSSEELLTAKYASLLSGALFSLECYVSCRRANGRVGLRQAGDETPD